MRKYLFSIKIIYRKKKKEIKKFHQRKIKKKFIRSKKKNLIIFKIVKIFKNKRYQLFYLLLIIKLFNQCTDKNKLFLNSKVLFLIFKLVKQILPN